jgi:hypothetical protein
MVAIIFTKIREYTKMSDNLVNIAFFVLIPIVFIFGFIGRIFIDSNWERYDWLDEVLINNVRYTGILILLVVSGLLYITFKQNKNFGEWVFLLAFLIFIPFLNVKTYAHFFFIAFSSLFIVISLTNIIRSKRKFKKYSINIFIVVLISGILFSGFYQHWRSHNETYGDKGTLTFWYMPESTFVSGVWIKEHVDKNLVANSMITAKRTFAISEVTTFIGYTGLEEFVYGLSTLDERDIDKNSPFSTKSYESGSLNPYVLNYSNMNSRGERSQLDYYNWLRENSIDNN